MLRFICHAPVEQLPYRSVTYKLLHTLWRNAWNLSQPERERERARASERPSCQMPSESIKVQIPKNPNPFSLSLSPFFCRPTTSVSSRIRHVCHRTDPTQPDQTRPDSKIALGAHFWINALNIDSSGTTEVWTDRMKMSTRCRILCISGRNIL